MEESLDLGPVARVESSAPGKLILFGEHSVVYGARAIAGAVSDLRIHVEVVSGTAVARRGSPRLILHRRSHVRLTEATPRPRLCSQCSARSRLARR
jgi:hypothetical protein